MSTTKRKSKDSRERELTMAIRRIELGRSAYGSKKVSFASVAREAGISTALIHNHHSKVAEIIRQKQGRTFREKENAALEKLREEKSKNKSLRLDVLALREKIAKLASINEVLDLELQDARARANTQNVVDHRKKRPS